MTQTKAPTNVPSVASPTVHAAQHTITKIPQARAAPAPAAVVPATNTTKSGPTPELALRAPSVLLLGPVGSGKTRALTTLIKAGLDLYVVATEPTGIDSLIDGVTQQKLDINKLHWKVIPPARTGFDMLENMAKSLSRMDHEQLSSMRPTPGRENAQWFQLLANIRNFYCDRCRTHHGSIMDLTPDKAAFSIDSLTGVSIMSQDITIGDKLTAHRGEWGAMMNNVEKFIRSCTSNFKCIFVLTAHVERETEEVSRGTKIMVSTLGSKLAPKIPRDFSEVVYPYRDGQNYHWSTMQNDVDLKHRALPLSPKLPPDFAPIVAAYQARLKTISQT